MSQQLKDYGLPFLQFEPGFLGYGAVEKVVLKFHVFHIK